MVPPLSPEASTVAASRPTRLPSRFTRPPLPLFPAAETVPEMMVSPASVLTVISPPETPLADVTLPAPSFVPRLERKKMRPFSPATALSALTIPFCARRPPKIPILPLLATISPRFNAWSSGALTTTAISGEKESTRLTERPAASSTSPLGAEMTPEFSTCGAISHTLPPDGVVMVP